MYKYKLKIFILLLITIGLGFLTMPGVSTAKEKKPGQLISIDYKDADLSTVLRAIAYSNDLNIVMTKDVKGIVSATLKDITVDEALDAILSVNGYAYKRKGNLIYIIEGPGTEGLGKETIHIRLSYLTAEDAKKLLADTISSQGNIQINKSTNSLIITDYSEFLDKVRNVIKEVDIQPIQVLIEAKIVDIKSTVFENIGTELSLTYDPRGSGSGGGIFNRSNNADESLGLTTSLPGTSTALTGNDMTFSATLKSLAADVTIDALVQEQKAKILASPSIATLNGKEARIIIGERFPYLETTRDSTGTATESTQFVDVGTTLRVTPMVSPDGWITMNVHPEVSSISAALEAGPRITTREADATIRVRDKQTIIIGGLINKKDDKTKAGVPVLKDIPFLGRLFSKRSGDFEGTELTVFITPKIIKNSVEAQEVQSIMGDKVFLDLKKDKIKNKELVYRLWDYVEGLEKKDIEDSGAPDLQRKKHMLRIYNIIVTQFPESLYADRALLRKGRVLYDLKDYIEAKNAFQDLMGYYPNSGYVEKAQRYLELIEKKRIARIQLIDDEMLSIGRSYR